MAAFFSLGSATNHIQQDPTESSSSWLLYSSSSTTTRTRPTTTKDFELWQELPLPHAHNLLPVANYSMGGGGGGGDGRFINFADESTWGSASFVVTGGGGGGSGTSGGVSCQDCGNQAKKDCPHIRCRTCCKSRGFQCHTHVKSTWVPAARRRERQQYNSATKQDDNHRHQLLQNTKRTRSVEDPGNPNLANPITAATAVASGLEVGNFPTEVTTQADFRCVRVSSIDETEDQIAYQAAVNIGGHLFKGILYDQGPESQYMGGDTSSGGDTSFSHSIYSSLGGNNDYMPSTQFFHQIPRD